MSAHRFVVCAWLHANCRHRMILISLYSSRDWPGDSLNRGKKLEEQLLFLAWDDMCHWHHPSRFFCFFPPTMQCCACCLCYWLPVPMAIATHSPIGPKPSCAAHTNKLPTTPDQSQGLKRPRDPSDDALMVLFSLLCLFVCLCIIQIMSRPGPIVFSQFCLIIINSGCKNVLSEYKILKICLFSCPSILFFSLLRAW